MAELMVDLIITLDGCASGEGWPGWWGLEGPEYLAWLQQEARTERTYLLGANTYRCRMMPRPGVQATRKTRALR